MIAATRLGEITPSPEQVALASRRRWINTMFPSPLANSQIAISFPENVCSATRMFWRHRLYVVCAHAFSMMSAVVLPRVATGVVRTSAGVRAAELAVRLRAAGLT
jgi:hypothetical protein